MNKKGAHKNFNNIGYFFVIPALIFMVVFIAYPVVSNIILGFQKVDVMTIASDTREFIGLQNYVNLFSDPVFRISMVNTFVFTISSLVVQFIIGFGFALLLNRPSRISKTLRGITMIAWMVPLAVTGLLFKFMFSVNGGIINQILVNLRLIKEPIEWLLHADTAMLSIIITNIWVAIPINMILLTTGLAGIPEDIYESANLDGASVIQKFTKITLPLLKPSILAVLMLGFVNTFKVFDIVFVMTGGGPLNGTQLLSTYSYQLSFVEFNFSGGAAAANILFVILIIVGLGYIKLINREEEVM